MAIAILISDFIKLILILIALFGFFLTIAGFPVGLIFLLTKFTSMRSKSLKERNNFIKIVIVLLFGGVGLLTFSFVAFALLQLVGVFSGIDINQIINQ